MKDHSMIFFAATGINDPYHEYLSVADVMNTLFERADMMVTCDPRYIKPMA
jgi:hypothetical protein